MEGSDRCCKTCQQGTCGGGGEEAPRGRPAGGLGGHLAEVSGQQVAAESLAELEALLAADAAYEAEDFDMATALELHGGDFFDIE